MSSNVVEQKYIENDRNQLYCKTKVYSTTEQKCLQRNDQTDHKSRIKNNV